MLTRHAIDLATLANVREQLFRASWERMVLLACLAQPEPLAALMAAAGALEPDDA